MSLKVDMLGRKFGLLTVVAEVFGGKSRVFAVECECGRKKTAVGSGLRNERIRSCGCIKGRYARKRPYEAQYNRFVASIERDTSYDCDLTFEDFVEFTKIKECHYCERLLDWPMWSTTNTARHNLDRMNNDLGYLKVNCIPCCTICNYAKGNRYTYGEWKAMTKALLKYRSKNG